MGSSLIGVLSVRTWTVSGPPPTAENSSSWTRLKPKTSAYHCSAAFRSTTKTWDVVERFDRRDLAHGFSSRASRVAVPPNEKKLSHREREHALLSLHTS